MTDDLPKIGYYILKNKQTVKVDLLEWSDAYEERMRSAIKGHDPWRVADTELDNCRVSTVFFGVDAFSFLCGKHFLFESHVFGGPLDGEDRRYHTWEEAEKGHNELVARLS